jgi:vacuole morphology and inheritance protein 14
MLLPQSSAFATLRNRLNSISPIGYLHLFPRPYIPIIPSNPYSAESTTRSDRSRLQKSKADEIKWNDLLEKFRSVQIRHEKARTRQPLLPRSPHIDTAPPTPSIGQKRSASTNQQNSQPTHKPRGRSIHTLTQGIMNVGRSGGEGKKPSQGGKRG